MAADELEGMKVYYTQNMKPGEWLIQGWEGTQYLLAGEGTDLQVMVFEMNLTKKDRRFLVAIKIGL